MRHLDYCFLLQSRLSEFQVHSMQLENLACFQPMSQPLLGSKSTSRFTASCDTFCLMTWSVTVAPWAHACVNHCVSASLTSLCTDWRFRLWLVFPFICTQDHLLSWEFLLVLNNRFRTFWLQRPVWVSSLWHHRWAPTDHKCSEFLVETPTPTSLIAMIASKRFSVAKLTNRQTPDSTEQWVKWKCCPVNATTSKVGNKAGGATLKHTKQNH